MTSQELFYSLSIIEWWFRVILELWPNVGSTHTWTLRFLLPVTRSLLPVGNKSSGNTMQDWSRTWKSWLMELPSLHPEMTGSPIRVFVHKLRYLNPLWQSVLTSFPWRHGSQSAFPHCALSICSGYSSFCGNSYNHLRKQVCNFRILKLLIHAFS